MAVYTVQGNNLLGKLGTAAQLIGTAAGVPALGTLGLGMSALGGIYNNNGFDNGYTTPGFQNVNNGGLFSPLGNLFSGNIAGNNPDLKTQKGK